MTKYGSTKPIADHELSIATAIATASKNILMLPFNKLASLTVAVHEDLNCGKIIERVWIVYAEADRRKDY
ncbi:cytochrome P450 monooxygenase 3A11 [Fusarium phyllophilum]|uniref:Cytochrome P450 monooxygenase 3A11 n=1 Tax=Fusarium phyllophilum TaxID=47803 RepID=A0A8H5MUH6_9HYPO|nr:cytochrome P450 monooxygenase 3A11 [Fusarium phyllophilum]